jgi:hypothetical protein
VKILARKIASALRGAVVRVGAGRENRLWRHGPTYRPGAVTLHTYSPMKMEQSVPKRWHLNYIRRGITQKKAHDFHNAAKI